MTTDYNNPPKHTLSWEECDKIAVHCLKFYKNLVDDSNPSHPEDIKYNKKLKKSVDFILKYLGENDEV